MKTIIDFLEESSKKFPQKIFIKTSTEELTYDATYKKIQHLSSSLNQYPEKSVISMIFDNCPEFIISYLGILKAGHIAHIISPSLNESNFLKQIDSSKPIFILSLKKFLGKFAKYENKIKFYDLDEIFNNDKILKNPLIENVASLMYTSGTTSNPKGVPITHSNITFTTKNIIEILKYNSSDIDVIPLPFSHSFGLGCLHVTLSIGSTIILHKNTMNPLEILKSIKENNATTFAAVPATLTTLVNNFPEKVSENCDKLRLIITNSTQVPKETVKKFLKLLPKTTIATYYGLTEASRSTFMIFNENKKSENCVGKPAPGITIKIHDENNHESNMGEIWIKGGNVIKNYWNDMYANRFLDDGIKTGDLGYLDSEGFLYLCGRKDNIINVAGEKVNPQEIENIVKKVKNVDDTVAIGVNHDLFGQVVGLFVKKVKNTQLESSEIITHCKNNLERYKVPMKIKFVDEFPKTEYGKIKRFMMKGNFDDE
jgi:long-chain acyl-CoA synthetase